MAPVFYDIDSTGITYQEFRFSNNALTSAIGWLSTKLGAKLPGSTDDPHVEALEPFEVGEHEVDLEARQRFAHAAAELGRLGFRHALWHRIVDPRHAVVIHRATFVHSSGSAIARIHERVWNHPRPEKVYFFVEFITPLGDGSFLYSTNGKPDMIAPTSMRTNRREGIAPAQLWQSHQQGVAAAGAHVGLIVTVEEARDTTERHHAALRDFHVQRGVFKPREGPAAGSIVTPGVRPPPLPGTMPPADFEPYRPPARHPEIIAEIDRLATRKTSWGAMIFILFLSIILFMGAGRSQFGSWTDLWLLLPILFFHEMGHYLTMKVFGYRNLRMFFIPFFGAAVSGRHFNIAGWKKVLVSLMGPVPGIVVGIGVGIAAMATGNELLHKAALLSLILNGFNLLPVLPLDGGWVMHTLIFSRHWVLDVLFRILASLALLGLGALAGDRFLIIIGGVMLVALPAVYKLARMTHELRQAGYRPVSPDGMELPEEVAAPIIDKVKAAFPKGVTARGVAQYTLQVFETLNARPPGVLATMGLGTVYGASIIVAIFFSMLLVLDRSGGIANFARAGAEMQYQLDPRAMASARGAEAEGMAPSDWATMVATYRNARAARDAFDGLSSRVPADAHWQLFGQSVLLVRPGDHQALAAQEAELKRYAQDVFYVPFGRTFSLKLMCIAPDEAVAASLEREISSYGAIPSDLYALPPWAPGDDRSADVRAAHERSRRTYMRMLALNRELDGNEEVQELDKAVEQAIRKKDEKELKALEDRQAKVWDGLINQKLDVMAREPDVDRELVEKYRTLDRSGKRDGWKEFYAWMGPRVGQMPMSDGKPAEALRRLAGQWTHVERSGLLITINVNFPHTLEAAPALVRWLDGMGCGTFRYHLDDPFRQFMSRERSR